MHTIETPFGEPGYLVLAGSRLVGIETPQSDYDYVGALIEPESYRLGLSTYTQGKNAQHGFEQHTFQAEGFEGTVYSLWKLVSMFAECNPTILSLFKNGYESIETCDHVHDNRRTALTCAEKLAKSLNKSLDNPA